MQVGSAAFALICWKGTPIAITWGTKGSANMYKFIAYISSDIPNMPPRRHENFFAASRPYNKICTILTYQLKQPVIHIEMMNTFFTDITVRTVQRVTEWNQGKMGCLPALVMASFTIAELILSIHPSLHIIHRSYSLISQNQPKIKFKITTKKTYSPSPPYAET